MRRSVTLPPAAALAIAGGFGWLIGSSALEPGTGTVVLAAGLVLTVWLVRVAVRAAAARPPERWQAGRLLRLAAVGVALVVGGSALLGVLGYGELSVPLGFGVVGALLLPASSLLGSRSYLLLGAGLMVVAAFGAVLALNSAGELYPRGLVGLGSGVLLWVTAALHGGVVGELRERSGR